MIDALQLLDLLPQTQCTRCGYPDCRSYAEAMAAGEAEVDRCAPGGDAGVQRLARLTGSRRQRLDPVYGHEGPRTVVWIDEAWCIGCTLCIKACPVDCIIGSPRQMHTVREVDCTGCELCVPACPVDCIQVETVTPGRAGWDAWTPEQAAAARLAHAQRQHRLAAAAAARAAEHEASARHTLEHLDTLTQPGDSPEQARKRTIIEAALARARARQQP